MTGAACLTAVVAFFMCSDDDGHGGRELHCWDALVLATGTKPAPQAHL